MKQEDSGYTLGPKDSLGSLYKDFSTAQEVEEWVKKEKKRLLKQGFREFSSKSFIQPELGEEESRC